MQPISPHEVTVSWVRPSVPDELRDPRHLTYVRVGSPFPPTGVPEPIETAPAVDVSISEPSEDYRTATGVPAASVAPFLDALRSAVMVAKPLTEGDRFDGSLVYLQLDPHSASKQSLRVELSEAAATQLLDAIRELTARIP